MSYEQSISQNQVLAMAFVYFCQ